MPYYQIDYFYLATGMEGRADEKDYGVWYGPDSSTAITMAINHHHPKMNEQDKDWVRGCLTSRLINNPKELR